MANINLDTLLAAAVDGDTIGPWLNSDTLLPPASPLGWLVNKEVAIIGPHPRLNQVGAGGARCVFATGAGAGDNNGFRIACPEGNIRIENVMLRGPGTAGSVTGTGCGMYTEPLMRTSISRTGNTSAFLKTITGLSTTADLFSGCPVYGTAIAGPPNFIDTVDSGTQVTLTVANPATITGATIWFGIASPGVRCPNLSVRNSMFWGFGLDGINLDSQDVLALEKVDTTGNGRHGIYLKNCVWSRIITGFSSSNGASGLFLDKCVNVLTHHRAFQANCRSSNSAYDTFGEVTVTGDSGAGYAHILRDLYFEEFGPPYYGAGAAFSLIGGSGALTNVLIDGPYATDAATGVLIRNDSSAVTKGYNFSKSNVGGLWTMVGTAQNYDGLSQRPA